MANKKTWAFALIILGSFCGCEKYLNEKPLQSLVVPRSLADLEALLNNANVVNSSPSLNELIADNYYVEMQDWQLLLSQSGFTPAYYGECMNYIWDAGATHSSWSDAYQLPVYYANVVLDALSGMSHEDGPRTDKIRGSALFYRSFVLERLAQLYAGPYSSAAKDDPGLVLRTTSDINERPVRATVYETYDLITGDLETAADLLPEHTVYPTHPSRAAAYAALARTYLSMRLYDNASLYADRCLALRSELMDYNAVDPGATPVFNEYNVEVIFHSRPIPPGILAASRAKISGELLDSYQNGDLRKVLFFLANTGTASGTYRFRGNYLGRFNPAGDMVFDGLTTGEMYLIRAECRARLGDTQGAMADLNALMGKRWINDGSWQPFRASSQEEALELVLAERRKELVFRGQRWTDLRRLNEEGRNITLTRSLGDDRYTLPPGDPRWVLLLPPETISLSNLTQNPR